MFQLFSCYIFNFFQVISALEHLEALSGERDAERSTIDSLQTQVKHLELEDSKKMEERQRNAKELEQGMTKMAATKMEGRAQFSEQRKTTNGDKRSQLEELRVLPEFALLANQ